MPVLDLDVMEWLKTRPGSPYTAPCHFVPHIIVRRWNQSDITWLVVPRLFMSDSLRCQSNDNLGISPGLNHQSAGHIIVHHNTRNSGKLLRWEACEMVIKTVAKKALMKTHNH
jgi:hypothetical protein